MSWPYPRGTAWACSGPSGGPSAPACWGRPVCSHSSSTGSASLEGDRFVGLVPLPQPLPSLPRGRAGVWLTWDRSALQWPQVWGWGPSAPCHRHGAARQSRFAATCRGEAIRQRAPAAVGRDKPRPLPKPPPSLPSFLPFTKRGSGNWGGGGWWDLAWKGPERQEPSRVVRDGRAFALEKAAGMKAKLAGVLNTRGDATCTPLHNHVHPCTATQPLRVLQATPLGGIWPKRPHSNRTEGLSPLSCPDSSHQPPPTVTQGTHLPPLRHIYPPGRRWAQPHPSPSSWWWARGEARAADSVFSRQCYTERKGERLKPGKE